MDESVAPLPRPEVASTDVDRLVALERQVRQVTSRLAGWVEAQLVQALDDRHNDLKALRSELQVVFNEQLAGARAESTSMLTVATRRLDVGQDELGERLRLLQEQLETRLAAEGERQRADLAAVRAEIESALAGAPRPADGGLEQRVRSAMTRLSESVEGELRQIRSTREGELDGLRSDFHKALAQQSTELRTEIATATAALRARSAQVSERLDAIEAQHEGEEQRLGAMVEARLVEVVEQRRAELEGMRWELQETLAKQLSEARSDIGASVSEAHLRFLLSVERLDERLTAMEQQATSAAARADDLLRTVDASGHRIEALELHTRRTDDRLGSLVEGKVSELAGDRTAELEAFRAELRDDLRDHLADTRAEVSRALREGRQELAAGTAGLAERRATLDRQAEEALAAISTLRASLERTVQEAEDRLGRTIDSRLAEVDATAAALDRTSLRMQEEVGARVQGLAEKVESLAAATATAQFAEAGVLAPLRSDMRLLQAQMAELAESVAQLPARRKAAPARAVPGKAAPARAVPGKATQPRRAGAPKKAAAAKSGTKPRPAASRRKPST